MFRMAIIMAVVAAAFVLDNYFNNNKLNELENIQAQSGEKSKEPGKVYVIAQTSPTTLKTSVSKNASRKLQVQLHDKFVRKYHSIRNYQVLKAEKATQTTPLISSYHYLVFQNYFFTPDDEPLS